MLRGSQSLSSLFSGGNLIDDRMKLPTVQHRNDFYQLMPCLAAFDINMSNLICVFASHPYQRGLNGIFFVKMGHSYYGRIELVKKADNGNPDAWG